MSFNNDSICKHLRFDAMQLLRDDARLLASRLKVESKNATVFDSYRTPSTNCSEEAATTEDDAARDDMDVSSRSFLSLIFASSSTSTSAEHRSLAPLANKPFLDHYESNMLVDQWFIIIIRFKFVF